MLAVFDQNANGKWSNILMATVLVPIMMIIARFGLKSPFFNIRRES